MTGTTDQSTNLSDLEDRLFEEFSKAVVLGGWESFSCRSAAAACDVSLAQSLLVFKNRYSYVSALIRQIDADMVADYDPSMGGEPARERLFDVLMSRFDAMQEHRDLIKALTCAARKDPMLALHLVAISRLTNDWIIEMAHISPVGVMGQMRAKGALLAYGRAFSIWLEDESEDMAKTMSSLDKVLKKGEKALRRAEKLACCLPRRRRSRKGSDRTDQDTGATVDEDAGLATVS